VTILTETRERFLRAIVAQVPPDRIAEIHFFSPIKQGGVESGVAVIAAWPWAPVTESPVADPAANDASDHGGEEIPGPSASVRHVVYTARYRLTLKGLDRGKWETNVVAEADAPLVTVEAVVRGVQHRAGDAEGPTRMDGEELRSVLDALSARSAS